MRTVICALCIVVLRLVRDKATGDWTTEAPHVRELEHFVRLFTDTADN